MSRLFLTEGKKFYIRQRVNQKAVQNPEPSFKVSYNFKTITNPEENLSCRQEYIQYTQARVAELRGTYEASVAPYDPHSGWLNILIEMVAPNTESQPTHQTKTNQKPKEDCG